MELRGVMRRILVMGFLMLGVGCGPVSVGEACDDVLNAACHRAAVCLGLGQADESTCVSSGALTCCGRAGTCQRDVKDSAAVGKCVDATNAEACAGWVAWNTSPTTTPIPSPAVCFGVAAPK